MTIDNFQLQIEMRSEVFNYQLEIVICQYFSSLRSLGTREEAPFVENQLLTVTLMVVLTLRP